MAKVSKTSQKIIGFAVLILFVAAVVLYIVYKSNHEIVPEGTVGATAGNLNNGGLFVEDNGTVYFANSYDEGCLYSMNEDQSDVKKLANVNVEYLNSAGNYLFYHGASVSTGTGIGSVIKNSGIYMIKKNGTKSRALTNETSGVLLVAGNNVYYQHYDKTKGTTFAKIGLKKFKSEEILDYMINPASYYNGNIYFNGMYDDHYLYTYNLATGTVTDIWEGDCWFPICQGDYVYYLDVLNNYRLCRYSISANTIEIITGDRVDCYNVLNGVIFYQKNSTTDPALKRINVDGTGEEVIASGNFTNINMTSTYTYFQDFSDTVSTYCTPTYGTASVRTFDAAREAMLKNLK